MVLSVEGRRVVTGTPTAVVDWPPVLPEVGDKVVGGDWVVVLLLLPLLALPNIGVVVMELPELSVVELVLGSWQP